MKSLFSVEEKPVTCTVTAALPTPSTAADENVMRCYKFPNCFKLIKSTKMYLVLKYIVLYVVFGDEVLELILVIIVCYESINKN